ncbi:MAG: EAL domain-containing protein [Cyanobacteria bacterium SBLK]|nr:EAL domain-containing protein [Cyanobacteria bacterium SBLK]
MYDNWTQQNPIALESTEETETLRLLAAAVRHAEDSILITTTDLDAPHPKIVFVNPAFTKLTGYTSEEVIGRSPRLLQGPNTDRALLRRMRETLAAGEVFYGETINYRKDGTEFYNEWHIEPIYSDRGEITHYLGIQRDVTARKLAEEELRRAVFHDSLTNLPNRTYFLKELYGILARSKQNPEIRFAVLFLDLDRFKAINDSLGHHAGDLLLCEIASRLQSCICSPHTVARFGGDEFAILLKDLENWDEIKHTSRAIHSLLEQPVFFTNQEMLTTASIGIAPSSIGYQNSDEILRDADIAMYQAKAEGKARSIVFEPAMRDRCLEKLAIETDLRKGIERNELQLYYQPIVSLETGAISGFEALVRWHHPTRGLMSPIQFIPIAEESDLIVSLGWKVLFLACQQLKQWQREFNFSDWVSVNLSGKQLVHPNFSACIQHLLEITGIDPRSLHLEITESAIMSNEDSAIANLQQLQKWGIQLSIDDFGTGYSSLSRLHCLPLSTLKIDKSFVTNLLAEKENLAIVKTIITLARHLKLNVIAEGVETHRQLAELRRLGCELVQGYLFAKPLPASEALNFLKVAA